MTNVTLSREHAVDLLDTEYMREPRFIDGYRLLAVQDVDSGRWESYHLLVIQRFDDGALFGADFRRGLTEQQETQPFEDEDEVTFKPVFAEAVVTTVYKVSA